MRNDQTKPEIQFLCRFLGDTCNESLFETIEPNSLLNVLKQHCLFPYFYKKWSSHVWSKSDKKWQDFTLKLKSLSTTNRMQMMQKAALLVRLSKHFSENRVPLIALKGPALAQRLYADVAIRVSGDLDILIKPADFHKAVQVLNSMGFVNKYITKGFSKKQSQFFFKNFRHFTFSSNRENHIIELHWQLNHMDNSSLTNDEIWESPENIILGGENIKVLNIRDELMFLIMHGLSHSFYRLQWLYDFYLLEKMMKSEDKEFINNNVLFQLAFAYSHYLFEDKPLNLHGNCKRFANHSLRLINNAPPKYHILRNWNDTRGRLILSKNLHSQISVLASKLTSPKDWYLLSLPDNLFFLYFILRPFLSITRIFSRKEKAKS